MGRRGEHLHARGGLVHRELHRVAMRVNEGQLGAVSQSGAWQLGAVSTNEGQEVAMNGHEWHLVGVRGNQWPSEAIGGHQPHSVALNRTHLRA